MIIRINLLQEVVIGHQTGCGCTQTIQQSKYESTTNGHNSGLRLGRPRLELVNVQEAPVPKLHESKLREMPSPDIWSLFGTISRPVLPEDLHVFLTSVSGTPASSGRCYIIVLYTWFYGFCTFLMEFWYWRFTHARCRPSLCKLPTQSQT